MADQPKSIYTSIAWRMMLDVLSRGSFVVISIFIGRRLGVVEYGKFGYVVSLVQIFYVFTDLGLHTQIIKELGEARGRRDDAWRPFYDLKLVLTAASFVIAGGLSMFLWRWENPWIPLCALLWMSGNSMLDFNQYLCNGIGRLDVAGAQILLHRLLLISFVVVALVWFPSLEGVLIGIAAGGAVGAVASNFYFFRALKAPPVFSFDLRRWADLLKISLPNAVGGAFGSWYLRVGTVVLGWVAAAETVGEYSAAFRIFETSYIVPAAIMAIAIPHLGEAKASGRETLAREIKRVIFLMSGLGAAWGALIFFSSPLAMPLLFGEKFNGAIPLLRMFGGLATAVFINYGVTCLMLIMDSQRRHAVHEMLAFVVCLLLYAILIPAYGARGTIAALFVTEAVRFLLAAVYLARRWRNPPQTLNFSTIRGL